VNDSTNAERRLIDQVAGRLTTRFPGVDPVTVLCVVDEIYARYDGRPVRDYVPLFVERNAVTELNRLAPTLDARNAVPLGITG